FHTCGCNSPATPPRVAGVRDIEMSRLLRVNTLKRAMMSATAALVVLLSLRCAYDTTAINVQDWAYRCLLHVIEPRSAMRSIDTFTIYLPAALTAAAVWFALRRVTRFVWLLAIASALIGAGSALMWVRTAHCCEFWEWRNPEMPATLSFISGGGL